MMSSSIRWSFAGGQVDWTMKTSCPRTFSPISTWISPSEKRPTSRLAERALEVLADAVGERGVGVPGEDLEVARLHGGAAD